jgi:hypothetical protein
MPTAETHNVDTGRPNGDATFPNRKAILLGWSPLFCVLILALCDIPITPWMAYSAFALAVLSACHQTVLFVRYVRLGGAHDFLGTQGASIWPILGLASLQLDQAGVAPFPLALEFVILTNLLGVALWVWYGLQKRKI